MTEDKKVRIDKWLWAARFFKTRALAKEAIEGGKVHYQGQRIKPGKTVELEALIELIRGFDRLEVVVCAISDKRGNATIAQQLYQETPQSIEAREKARETRQAQGVTHDKKPDKKQRRMIHRFKRINSQG